MAQAIDLDQPLAQLTRTELTLKQLGETWSRQYGGRAYASALVDFLRSHRNPNTLRAYSTSILQFFGWLAKARRGQVATPDQVQRGDAAGFDEWLRTTTEGLRSWYLAQDPSRELDLKLFEIIGQRGRARQEEISEALYFTQWRQLQQRQDMLAHRLACLVRAHTLERTPSIAQIRRGEVDVGLAPELARRVGLEVPVPWGAFIYQVPTKGTEPANRAPTVAARLTALSAFWNHLVHHGDNRPGAQPLLRVNIWRDLHRKAARQAPAVTRAYRQQTNTTLSIFERLLATTYRDQYGAEADQRAAADMRTDVTPPPKATRDPSYADLRDRALLLLLGQVGLRAEETQRLRRRDVRGDPVTLHIHGKGDKVRQVALPPRVLAALQDLTNKLSSMARHQAKYGRRGRAEALLSPEAPLIPAVKRWGANATATIGSIGRSGIAMMLRRRAVRAGIEPGSDAFARVHPHGIRHLFAKAALAAGTPLNAVQGMLGHARGSQTLQYAEEHDPQALISRAFADVAGLPAPAPPVPAPPAPRPAAPEAQAGPEPAPRRRVEVQVPPTIDVVETAPTPPAPEPATLPEPDVPQAPEPVGAPLVFGLGEELEPPPPIRDEILDAQEEALSQLDRIYEHNWGERGHRQRLEPTAAPVEDELAELLADDDLGALFGEEEIVASYGVGQGRLTHTYVGRSSGLVWWQGSGGKLKQAMPVMSPAQALSCGDDEQTEVCRALSELWLLWASGEGQGPTGAGALAAWFGEALETAAQVDAEVRARGGRWVADDAPWDETADDESPRSVFREHALDAIVAWFETQGWQHRRYGTRGETVVDKPLEAPAYYAQGDPLREMAEEERMDLLGWIAAMSGQPIEDRRRLYEGVSRADIARIVRGMCAYDEQRARIGEEKASQRQGETSAQAVLAAQRAAQRAAADVDRTVMATGRGAGFSIEREVDERVSKRKQGTRERMVDFYLTQIGKLFGDEAAADPVVKVLAMCNNVPLAQEPFGDLFRVDWVAQTIRSRPDFASQFAQDTMAHSECVGRRIARDLWELQKKHMAGKRQRLLIRPDELVERVQTMAAYRIPCPAELERELAMRLPRRLRTKPLPLYEAWRAAQRAEDIATTTHSRAAIAEELSDFAEDYGSAAAGDWIGGGGVMFENPARARPLQLTPAIAAVLPSPLHQLAAVLGVR